MVSTSHSIPQELRAHYRRVRNRGASGCGLWGIRLFILPHTIVGLCCLFLMPASVIWAAFGTDHLARVERTWVTTGSKGSTTYHVGYVYETGGARRKGEGTVSAQTFQRVSATRPRGAEAATVRVRSIGSPPAFYEGLAEGRAGAWGTVGF